MSSIRFFSARLALGVAAFGTLTAAISCALAIAGGVRLRRLTHRAHRPYTPPVSILKPVHGTEAEQWQNFRSFFEIDYPAFEVIFCARSLNDPAILCARRVAAGFPSVSARFIASGEPLWTNPKTYSMAALARKAAHEIILFSDSDVRVGRDYLRRVVQPLADPSVGLVTCAFRGKPAPGLPSLLIALNQTVEFSSGVLTANLLEGMKFGLGPTLLTRKSDLQAIGGLAAMHDRLADDFWLGNCLAHTGRAVVLSPVVVEHFVSYPTLAAGMRHQVGWMKNTRRSRPAGHIGLGLTYAMPFGVLGLVAGLVLGQPAWAFGLLLIAVLNRWLQAIVIGAWVMRDPIARRCFLLMPVCDLLGFSSWLVSFFGDVIDYRGEKYLLEPGGQIVPLDRPRPSDQHPRSAA